MQTTYCTDLSIMMTLFPFPINIEAHKGLAQATIQHHIAVVRIVTLGSRRAGRDLRAVEHGVAQRLQPGQHRLLDGRFSEGHGPSSSATCV